MTKVALCWATGSDMGRQVRNPASAGAESMFPETEKKSEVDWACQMLMSSTELSAIVVEREGCIALEKRRLFSSLVSRISGGSSPGTARRLVRSTIDASCSNSNGSGGATPSSFGERDQAGAICKELGIAGFGLWATAGRS